MGVARPTGAVVAADRHGQSAQFIPVPGGQAPDGPSPCGAVHHLSVTGPTWVRSGDLEDPVGVGLHGVAELTVLLAGELEHRDSLGHRMVLSGPAALLVAGGGGVVTETGPSRALRRDGGDLHTVTLRWVQDEVAVPTVRQAEGPAARRQARSSVVTWCGPGAPLDPGGVALHQVEVALGGVVDLDVGEGPAVVAVLRGRVLVGEGLVEVRAGRLVPLSGPGTRLQLATHLGDEQAPQVLVVVAPDAPPAVLHRSGLLAAADESGVDAAVEGSRDGAFGTLPQLDG